MRRPYNNHATFLDFIFNILFGIFVLFSISMVMLNADPEKNKKKGDIDLKAEYIITMEWETGSPDDVDLHVTLPNHSRVFYGMPNGMAASLDRDSRGYLNDNIRMDDGSVVELKDRWEHVIIRKTIPGEYMVHVNNFSSLSKKPVKVSIKLEKLNPYALEIVNSFILTEKETRTAFVFTINKEGKIIQKSTSIKRPLETQRYGDQ